MLRLSFIVPFYNVEPYIEECIRSLYNQDIPWEEYEVICIDDCSPDGSRAIVERLQQEYPTLKLLRTPENLRQGGARNMGLDIAQGKYIWFVDSDDYIQANCLCRMLECAEKYEVDLLPFYFTFSNHDKSFYAGSLMLQYGICSGSHYIFDAIISIPTNIRCSCVWSQLISKALIDTYHLRFVEHLQYEDDDFACQLFAFADRVYLIDIFPYIARPNIESTTKQEASYRTILDIMYQAERLIALAPSLCHKDGRWRDWVKKQVRWSLKERVLFPLHSLPLKERLSFFIMREGWIKHCTQYVGWRTYIALHSYLYWQFFYR